MSLAEALDVKQGAVVSFVGGGGKTTSLFRLAEELVHRGMRVVTTTTTHISQDQMAFSPCILSTSNLSGLKQSLDRHGQCLLVGVSDGKGRVFGAPPEQIAEIHARPDVDAVLIEADGSRSLPFKAPAGHEPVVHPLTTVLAPIVGLEVLDMPLDEDHVHRAALAAGIAQRPLGSPVTEEVIARVLAHPQGGAKQRPAGAHFVPLLNKADTEALADRGRRIAELLLSSNTVTTAVVCRLNDPESPIDLFLREDPPPRESDERRSKSAAEERKHTRQPGDGR